MCLDLAQVPASTIGSIVAWPIIAALTLFVQKWILPRLQRHKLRCILGEDALLGSDFYAVTTNFAPGFMYADGTLAFSATDANGNPIRPVYVKRHARRTSDGLSISAVTIRNPLSGGGAKALAHFLRLMHGNSKKPVSTSLDYDLAQKQDISFISFGGPLSNHKTADALSDSANNLINFVEAGNNGYFEDPETGQRIAEPDPVHDHGLILKFHPEDHDKRTWLVCAGFDEPGTSGAASYLANKWRKIYRDVKKDSFAVVVRVSRNQGDESAHPVWGKAHTRKGAKYLYQEQTRD